MHIRVTVSDELSLCTLLKTEVLKSVNSQLLTWQIEDLIGLDNLNTYYSRSSPCNHSCKQPALVMTAFVKPHLNCDLNFVMKSSRKRPLL